MSQLANRPAFLGQGSSSITEALAGGLSASMPARISTKNDRFQPMDENGQPTMPAQLELDIVVVGANPNKSRVYYPESNDVDAGLPPDCFSDNGIAPSENAINPQHATCAGCPRAVWGKVNAKGNTVPWCQSRKKMAVLVIGGGPDVYLMDVPPKSHKLGLQPYIDHLRREGADTCDVITTVSIKDKIWSFKEKGWLPNEKTYKFVQEVVKSDIPANVVNAFDKPRQGALPPPRPGAVEAFKPEPPTRQLEPQPPIKQIESAPPKADGPSSETQAKLDSLFAKFGPK